MSSVNPVYHHTAQMLTDEFDCIVKAKENPLHFGPLYTKYYDQILRYVRQRINDDLLADDVTSQVFIKAIENLKKYEFRGVPLASWLYRIAYSEVNQAYRNKRARREVNLEVPHIATFMEVFKEETSALNKRRLLNALSQLNGRDLQLIELRYFEDRPYKEIADILEITENNAKVRTFRAVEKLKRVF